MQTNATRPVFRLIRGRSWRARSGCSGTTSTGRSRQGGRFRVFMDGMWQYEPWFRRGDAGTIYGMRGLLAAAQELYQQKLR